MKLRLILLQAMKIVLSANGSVCTFVGIATLVDAYSKDGWIWYELLMCMLLIAGAAYIIGKEFLAAAPKNPNGTST